MQRWAWIVVLLYGVIAILLTWPVLFLGFIKTETKVNILATFSSWTYWTWLTVMLLSQATLLAAPVKIAERRPVTRQAIISSVLGGAFMMGILIFGAVASIGETIVHDSLYKPIWYAALIELVLMWILWAVIFFRWSKRLEPRTLVEKQRRWIYRSSILELLIAVPTHVIVRQKEYCCAGFSTFVGIVLGLAVMLFSFGPGIFFLYAERWKNISKRSCTI